MTDETWGITPTPFDADGALLALKRFARDQRGLSERGEGWLLGAEVVLKLAVDGPAVTAQLARRPARSPEWDRFTVASAPDSRKLQDEVKRRLARWQGEA